MAEQERVLTGLTTDDIHMSDNAGEENSDYEEEYLDENGRTLGLGLEDYMESELISAWHIRFMDELSTRKYGDLFSDEMDRVDEWVYKHRDIIWDTPFEEQEQMMIADGVLTPEDI